MFLFILENTKFLLYPCGEIYENNFLQRAFQISEVPPPYAIYQVIRKVWNVDFMFSFKIRLLL